MTFTTGADGLRTMVRDHASGGTFADTRSTLRFNPTTAGDAASITIVSRMLPGLAWWERPSAATMRRWVDDLLRGSGYARHGRCEYVAGGSVTTWATTYYARKV